MPEVEAKEYRTIMYSVVDGQVVVHKFPFNANEKYGMTKLQRLVKRGFTFADPRQQVPSPLPEVIVTRVVDLSKPISAESEENKSSDSVQDKPIEPKESALSETPDTTLKVKRQAQAAKMRAAKAAKRNNKA